MRILLILHGFLGLSTMMNEIVECFNSQQKYFDHIWNLSYYDSPAGLDLNQPVNIGTPIFDTASNVSLVENLYSKLLNNITTLNCSEKINFTVIAHSLGGLVIRALIAYKCIFRTNKQWLNDNSFFSSLFLFGSPNHGTYLADKWLIIPAETLIELLTKLFSLKNSDLKESHFINNSQMTQMETKSTFLKALNKENSLKGCNIVNFRGEASKTDIFTILFQPVFWRFW